MVVEAIIGVEGVDDGVHGAAVHFRPHVELAPALLPHVLVNELPPELRPTRPAGPVGGPP